MRTEMTVSEKWVWSVVRNSRLGFKFRRQFPIDRFVLDFYCAEIRVCLEVDGPHHQLRTERDSERDAFLASLGIATLRIPTEDIFENGAYWQDRIREFCEARKVQESEFKHPHPSVPSP